jgi:hypothetical protein
MVDLPSSGSALVTTTQRARRSGSTNCRLVRRCRIASPRGDQAASSTSSGLPAACASCGTAARIAFRLAARSAAAERMLLSRISRSTAPAAPATSPSSSAIAKLRAGRGLIGSVPTRGPVTTSTRPVGSRRPGGVSSAATSAANLVATAWAMRSDRALSVSTTVTSSSTVSGMVRALMRRWTSAASSPTAGSAATAPASRSLPTRFT